MISGNPKKETFIKDRLVSMLVEFSHAYVNKNHILWVKLNTLLTKFKPNGSRYSDKNMFQIEHLTRTYYQIALWNAKIKMVITEFCIGHNEKRPLIALLSSKWKQTWKQKSSAQPAKAERDVSRRFSRHNTKGCR